MIDCLYYNNHYHDTLDTFVIQFPNLKNLLCSIPSSLCQFIGSVSSIYLDFIPFHFFFSYNKAISSIFEELPKSDFQNIQMVTYDLHISNLFCNMHKTFFCYNCLQNLLLVVRYLWDFKLHNN